MRARSPLGHAFGFLVVFAALWCSATRAGAQTLDAALDRLRAPDRVLFNTLRAGAERSATMTALLRRLALRRGVVYVTQSVAIGKGREACLLHQISGSGETRYLRILVKWGLTANQLVAVVAHELQHAVEVLEAPEVRDSASMESLFQRIGDHRGLGRYETGAAVAIQARVFAELRGGPRGSEVLGF